jgi:hypothetical protein
LDRGRGGGDIDLDGTASIDAVARGGVPVVEKLVLAAVEAVSEPPLGSAVCDGETIEKGETVLGEGEEILWDRCVYSARGGKKRPDKETKHEERRGRQGADELEVRLRSSDSELR